MTFKLHTQQSAPAESRPLLEKSHKVFGMIPNLHAIMAESPALLEGYQTMHQLFQSTSFDNEEMTVIWQTINVEHACHYCIPAHAAIADMMAVDRKITEALRNQSELPNKKLQTLHLTTLALVRNRGHLSEEEVAAFFAAGYQQRQLLEIIVGISQKVMSNYVNHLAQTPVDDAFKAYV